ncbi:hypothetical protein [Cyanobium sp. T1G-Tous]|uniref:hypothetical protein n=1 Tax=Cyanobium sp. T1G-Tous TaxID=2823722 RepID=UPI0020CEE688|nr:hypothetical protein [Cyanobium sp. T1G-Tous]
MEHPLGELQFNVQLLHAEAGSRVVLVQISRAGQVIDAALGEASTAEAAEDRARQRLGEHLPVAAPPTSSAPTPVRVSSPPAQVQPKPQAERPAAPSPPPAQAIEEPPADPEDWSSELARLDLQLQRLGWNREQEAIYLERVFGHPNRNRLTSYGDLLAYLQALEGFADGSDPASAPPPLRRKELLSQCEELLSQLEWDPGQGRAFLEQHFALAGRQLLSDSQLLQFNMLLEEEFIKTRQKPLHN